MKRAYFKKQYFDYPIVWCFYCNQRPTGVLTFLKTGEEIRTCDSCAGKYGKIKRFSRNRYKTPTKERNSILESNSCVENKNKGIEGTK